MKLVIQIPCYNEQDTIAEVINNIPKQIEGVDEIKIIVIDDGSSDNTVKIAQDLNVEILKSNKNYGLSHTFMTGIEKAIKETTDILVNIDGDNQYRASEIEKLIQPILKKQADIVIGTRPISKIKEFSFLKKFLQKFGSSIVKFLSKTQVYDAASGFRAYSRKAILKTNIFNPFTYTIEGIIQANIKNLKITNVDIEVNAQQNRKSKLFKNNFDYIYKQAKNTVRFLIIYKPAQFFNFIATLLLILGLIIALRFLYFYINTQGSGHIQSLILCSIFIFGSFISYMLAIVGDLFSINRKLLEDIQYKLRKKE